MAKKRLTGTRQWAKRSENCFKGCKYDCKYCYAKKNAIRFKQKTAENWHEMEYNPNCEKHITKHDGKIMFPTTHDLHIVNVHKWLPFLKGLLEKGNEVLIVTKPEFAAVSKMCIDLFEFRDQIEFRFTIGTADEYVRQFWEPNAPSIPERLLALKVACVAGYKTSVSMEPLLDYDPETVINTVNEWVTESIWIGTMNHMRVSDFGDNEKVWYLRMNQINSHLSIERIYDKYKDNPKILWKDSIQKMMGLDD